MPRKLLNDSRSSSATNDGSTAHPFPHDLVEPYAAQRALTLTLTLTLIGTLTS